MGSLVVGTLGAVTLKTIISDGGNTTSNPILSEFEDIEIERYYVNDSTGIIMKINISSKNYTDIAHYVAEEEPNVWELVMAIQELNQENDNLKIALCNLDKTNSTGIC